jgi:hypothetical protein
LVQERVGNTLELIGISKDFLNGTTAAQQLRDSIDKWDFIKIKSFCSTKEMVSKLKRPPTEWEKIFASYTSDKGLITRLSDTFPLQWWNSSRVQLQADSTNTQTLTKPNWAFKST